MDLSSDLIESDAAYFDAGASLETADGATLSRVAGFESIPAAAVVHRIDELRASQDPRKWIHGFETRLRSHKLKYARFYLDRSTRSLDTEFERRGYTRGVEVGLVKNLTAARFLPEGFDGVDLRPVTSKSDWETKLQLQSACTTGADGYPSNAARFIQLEQRKAAAGYMRAYLITRHGEACGAISIARVGSLMRLKNMVVHPKYRRCGLGSFAALRIAQFSDELGAGGAGCFALAGHHSVEMYLRAGYHEVVTLVEWKRPLCVVDLRAEIAPPPVALASKAD